jgi:Txe/YoeB family toxin of toxin-antitoxin system
VLAMSEYNSLEETAYLLRSPANAEHLSRGVEAVRNMGGEMKVMLLLILTKYGSSINMPTALEDIEFWGKSGNIQIQKRISVLLEAISVNPYEGTGNPEKLKYELNEYWSRRINLM